MVEPARSRQHDRPFRIDVHYHICPPRFMANQEKRNPKWGAADAKQVVPATIDIKSWTPTFARDDLDRNGVATAIVQMISARGVWFGDVQAACDLAREWNDYAAQMTRDFPGRFGMLAAMPMPDIDSTLREIEYAFDVLHADGVQLMSHYDGKYPGDPTFRPVLEELNRRKAVVFIHPYLPPSANVLTGVRPATIEFPVDSTRAIVSLVLSGTTAQLPNIKFIFCHGGGVLPSLAGRIEQLTKHDEGRSERVPHGIEFELRKLYYEIANAYHPPSFAGLQALAPASHIMFGTDFPYLTLKSHIDGLAKVVPAENARRAIERDNALALFPKFAEP